MPKLLLRVLAVLAILVGGFYALNAYIYNEKQGDGGQRQRGDVVPTGLIGGGWTWVRTELPDGKTMDAPAGGQFVLSFDEDGLAASTTDCNQMSGSYTKSDDALTFGAFAMTKMYCEGSMEGEYARQLALTSSHAIEGDTLRLVLGENGGTMVFTRDASEHSAE